jgi:hypothetical protein
MTASIRIDGSWTADKNGAPRPIRFCSRCGNACSQPPSRPHHQLDGRVCRECGLGLMLTCAEDAVPGKGAAFLIATFDLRVSAVSQAAERVLGPEQSLVGLPVLDFLTSPTGDDRFAQQVGTAAERASRPVVLPVRLRSWDADRAGTMAARISTCGPPRAALITVVTTKFGRR